MQSQHALRYVWSLRNFIQNNVEVCLIICHMRLFFFCLISRLDTCKRLNTSQIKLLLRFISCKTAEGICSLEFHACFIHFSVSQRWWGYCLFHRHPRSFVSNTRQRRALRASWEGQGGGLGFTVSLYILFQRGPWLYRFPIQNIFIDLNVDLWNQHSIDVEFLKFSLHNFNCETGSELRTTY